MPATSFHTETGRWLTTFDRNSKQGDVHTISQGHPIRGGEFTTYRLPAPVADSKWGPLFDLDQEAEIEFEGRFYSKADLLALRDAEFERTWTGFWKRKVREPA